jgi:general secretion pathway protein D
MPFYKGLARVNSIALAFVLAFHSVMVPVPLAAKTRKGEKLMRDAQIAEAKGEYDKALELYEQALATDPRDTAYKLGLDRLRFQAAQKMVDRGEKLRSEGKLEEALAIFQKAFALDPASSIAEQRMRQTFDMIKREKKDGKKEEPEDRGLTAAERVRKQNEAKLDTLMDAPVLKPIQREIVNLKMNNQPAKVLFETLSKMAGINVMFDPDFISQNQGKNYPVDFQNTTLEEALDYLSLLTKAYWKPISQNAIYVTLENPQKRRDFEDYILKVFYLQHALEPQELQEIANAIRVVGECRKVVPYAAQMALMVRCTADQVALVQKIINDMDKPRSEIVLDVFILEANRTKTRSLAATLANGAKPGLNQTISFTRGTSTSGTTTTTANPTLASLGRLSTNDFSINMPGAFLQALLDDRTTRVVQNPQVRTVDNKKASLRIGDRYPYATGSFNVGTGVGTGTPIASTQFQFAEVGVNIDITPKIHGNEEISLRVEVEVSNIRDQVDIGGVRQPVIGQRKIGEDIRIREGEVNVMGGLKANTRSRNLSGLPWLVGLPGLGWLFGTEGNDANDSELLVVLVPHLVRAPELTDLNLRGISTGTDQQVRVSFQTKEEPKPTPAATPAPPMAKPLVGPPAVPQSAVPVNPAMPVPMLGIAGAGRGVPLDAMQPRNKLSLQAHSGPFHLSAPVQVTLNLESATDLAKAPITIEYDKQLLKLVSVSSGGLLGSDGIQERMNLDLGKGEVDLSRVDTSKGITGSGALLKLTFVSLAKGEAAIRVTDAKLRNSRDEVVMPGELPELKVNIED